MTSANAKCACDLSGTPPRHSDDCEYMTIDQVREMAMERGVPGPDVALHDEDYDGECYCQDCLSYF